MKKDDKVKKVATKKVEPAKKVEAKKPATKKVEPAKKVEAKKPAAKKAEPVPDRPDANAPACRASIAIAELKPNVDA